jgi:hypothetical protein
VQKYRIQLEGYINNNPDFLSSLEPLPIPAHAPRIVKRMAEAAQAASVGPMAAVAGAIAEAVGEELLEFSPEVIVENGGDIYLKVSNDTVVGIYAGGSPLTGKIGLKIGANDTPLGICTSSGTVGHSLSFGKADAVVVLSASTTLADAAATAVGNMVNQAEDIERGIQHARGIEGVKGILIIVREKLGVWGSVNVCPT